MTFSKASQYAIRALTYLATHYPDSLCPLEKIAAEERIPQPFLGKILQRLAHKRIIRSVKGLNGGFGLAADTHKITLYSVVDAIDDVSITSLDCVLGRSECNEEQACPLHHYWKEQRASHLEFLHAVTLRDMSASQTGGTGDPRALRLLRRGAPSRRKISTTTAQIIRKKGKESL